MPVNRRGAGLPGTTDRIGDARIATALSNPRITGAPEEMELTFASKVTGATGHGTEHAGGGGLTGRARLGSSGHTSVHEILGYTDGTKSSEEHAVADEFERTTTTTYSGLVYPVTYDLSVLGGSRDAAAGSTVTGGDEAGSWHHQEAHRENAVRIWVPADELHQLGLDHLPEVEQPTAGHAGHLPPESDIDGHAPVSIRPEITRQAPDAARDQADLVTP